MRRTDNPNIEILTLAVQRLGPLTEELVFLGGCAAGLLITDPAAPPIRATKDVDTIVELSSRGDYHRLGEQLRARGFSEDSSDGAPICRWRADALLLDVMPTDPQLLGFGNHWYLPALHTATLHTLPSGHSLRVVTAPYFLATKLEAFDGRGGDDYLLSHDIEDLVAVLDGRPELLHEIEHDPTELRLYLAERFQTLGGDRRFVDAMAGHLPADAASQQRLPALIERVHRLGRLP